jgi:hypothetical protein
MISLANPTNSGVANSSSMIVPRMVNSLRVALALQGSWSAGPVSAR